MIDEHIIAHADAKAMGVNFDTVDLCRTIRHIAECDRLRLDESVHRDNKYNKHLFSYIEYCGLNPLDYIKDYLKNIQPYMITQRKDQEKKNSIICVLDEVYRVSLYIKLDKEKNNEIIISFHENIRNGIAPENNTLISTPRYNAQVVPVFAEPTGARIEGSSRQEVKVLVQRGMLVFPVIVMASKCEGNIYLIERGSIENAILELCNQYLRDLYSSKVDLKAMDDVEIFSVLQQISFTSFGNSIVSNLTLLMDNHDIQRGLASRSAASFALKTYIDHLYLTEEQAEEIVAILNEKYNVHSSKDFEKLLNYVIDNVTAISVKTNEIVDSVGEATADLEKLEEQNSFENVYDDENSTVISVSRRFSGR